MSSNNNQQAGGQWTRYSFLESKNMFKSWVPDDFKSQKKRRQNRKRKDTVSTSPKQEDDFKKETQQECNIKRKSSVIGKRPPQSVVSNASRSIVQYNFSSIGEEKELIQIEDHSCKRQKLQVVSSSNVVATKRKQSADGHYLMLWNLNTNKQESCNMDTIIAPPSPSISISSMPISRIYGQDESKAPILRHEQEELVQEVATKVFVQQDKKAAVAQVILNHSEQWHVQQQQLRGGPLNEAGGEVPQQQEQHLLQPLIIPPFSIQNLPRAIPQQTLFPSHEMQHAVSALGEHNKVVSREDMNPSQLFKMSMSFLMSSSQ